MGFLASGKELPVLSDNNSNRMIKKRKKIKFHAVITFFFFFFAVEFPFLLHAQLQRHTL